MKIPSIVIVLLLSLLSACKDKPKAADEVVTNVSTDEVHMPDTIMYEGTTVRLNIIDSTAFMSLPGHTMIRDSVALVRDSAVVYTHDSTLVLKLDNGDSVTLTSTPGIENDAYIGYVYRGLIKELNSYLIQVVYYEGGEFLLCNKKSGIKTTIIGMPVMNTDSDRVACFNSDIMAGFTANGFQVFTPEGDSLRTLWQASPQWGPVEGRWKNNGTLYIKAEYWDSLIRTRYLSLSLPEFR